MQSLRFAASLVLLLALLACSYASADPAPLPFVPGSWTLVLLPDTQNYSADYPQIFNAQTKWIVANKESRNIALVLHEGDIVKRSKPQEWENARAAMSILDGKVPYLVVPGNHDYDVGGQPSRSTQISKYFPVDKFSKWPTFGGVYEKDKIDNSYQLFSAGGRGWIAIGLESAPRDEVVSWADKVLKQFPDRLGIIVTHAYLYNDNTRYDYRKYPDQKWAPHGSAKKPRAGVNDGEELWQKLVSPNANMRFVFNGHVLGDGAGRLVSTGEHGNTINQVLLNCQSYEEGGSGYLGLVEFLPDGKTVQFRTYSPYLDKYLTDDDHQFVLQMSP